MAPAMWERHIPLSWFPFPATANRVRGFSLLVRAGAAKTVAGRIRKIGIVALARKLLVALWRYLETGEIPAGAELKA
jgi:hypothetical protein